MTDVETNGVAPEVEKSANGSAPDGSPHAHLADALLAAQAEMPAVEPDKTNPHFKSKFVSLGNLLAKVRPVLNRHGLVLIQAPRLDDQGRFVLRTTILHSSNESLIFDSPLTPTKNDPQGQGSAITYMRRYALAASLAIADQEDDDGDAGSAPSSPPAAAESQAKVGLDIARKIVERAGEVPGAVTNLRLSASHIIGRDVGELEDPGEATQKLAEALTFPQAERLQNWIERKAKEEENTVDPTDLPGGESGE